MNAVPTTIIEHLFININFLYFLLGKNARGFQRRPFESSKKLVENAFSLQVLETRTCSKTMA